MSSDPTSTPEPSSTPAEGASADDASSAPPALAGETPPSGDDPDGAPGASLDDAADDGPAEGGAAPEDRPKKKRRRKKKPGARAEGGEGSSRGPRPATDRVPFHVGEEVFGKVTAVLDDAIMIDLSGKALAVFDRSEMAADDLVPTAGDRFVAAVHNDGGRGGLVVLTRKPLREEETKPLVEQAFKEGALVSGLVTGVIKGGVEVDIGGLRAFAPASGMDLHPANANFTALLGTRLEFKVVEFKPNGRDVVVTRRPMLEAEAHERRVRALALLTEGQKMTGVVRTVVEWGLFVALPEAENLEGLVHVTEASHDPRANLAELFKPGESVEVQIVRIDDKGKIWLSRKALIEDPWAQAKQRYAPGSEHQGKVTRVERFGLFVELEPGMEGLIHVSDLGLDRAAEPSSVATVGQERAVVVQHFDAKTKKLALHPALPPERADEPRQKVVRGATVTVEVVKAEGSAGLVVRLLGVTGKAGRGFIPSGQTGTQRGTDLRKHFKQGTRLEAKIIEVDPRRGEPKLSLRALAEDEERTAHREYRKALAREGGFGTLGDLLAKKLGDGSK